MKAINLVNTAKKLPKFSQKEFDKFISVGLERQYQSKKSRKLN